MLPCPLDMFAVSTCPGCNKRIPTPADETIDSFYCQLCGMLLVRKPGNKLERSIFDDVDA